jgi:hypothetical protein
MKSPIAGGLLGGIELAALFSIFSGRSDRAIIFAMAIGLLVTGIAMIVGTERDNE